MSVLTSCPASSMRLLSHGEMAARRREEVATHPSPHTIEMSWGRCEAWQYLLYSRLGLSYIGS